jgi:sortase A
VRLAKVLGAVGRTLISAGVLILLFVAYQLWGTGISEARSQHRLRQEFNAALDQSTSSTPTSKSTGTTTGTSVGGSTSTTDDPTIATTPPSTAPPLDTKLAEGDALGRIVIPKIHLDTIVVQGVDLGDLKKGPGHYPNTPLPGEAGNAAIAGHRTTYGAPFGNVDQLEAGDEIDITTVQGSFRYEVSDKQVVSPSKVQVLDNQGDNRLTLTSCHPKYSARQRIVITAVLKNQPLPTQTKTPGKVSQGEATLGGSLSGEGAPKLPAILWGLLAAAIWFGAWLAGRHWRKPWMAYAIGVLPFLVVLFFFFENFSRLLPANF